MLRKDLTRNAGGSLTDKTAAEVMEAIKKLAVQEVNTMVARVQLHNIRQDRDEMIRIDGFGRMTTRNRKSLRKYLPVQTTPPRLTIDDDLRHLAMLPPRPITQAKSSPAPRPVELPPQPSPAKPQGYPPPAALAPDHTGSSPKRCAPQQPPTYKTPPTTAKPLVPVSSSKTTTHNMRSCPPTDPSAPLSPGHLQHGRGNLP